MDDFWVSLQGIPPSGQTFSYSDSAVWNALFVEFDLACRVTDSLDAKIFVMAQETGVLFKGTVEGLLALPCDRCTEASPTTIRASFATMETFPAIPVRPQTKGKPPKKAPADTTADEEDLLLADAPDEAVIRLAKRGNGYEVNPLAIAWEELVLSLPAKPLCSKGCKGLCQTCGHNLNSGPCSCSDTQGDPRFAALRSLKISR